MEALAYLLAAGIILCAIRPRPDPAPPEPPGEAFAHSIYGDVRLEVEQHAYWIARQAACFARWGDPGGLKREAQAAAHSFTAGTFPEQFMHAAVCVQPPARRRLLLAGLAYGQTGGEAEWHGLVRAAKFLADEVCHGR